MSVVSLNYLKLYGAVFSISGPLDIVKLCGKRHENRIKIEAEAGGYLTIVIPKQGTAENDARMVTLKGPDSFLKHWGQKLCSEYAKVGAMRPVKSSRTTIIEGRRTFDNVFGRLGAERQNEDRNSGIQGVA